MKPLLFHPGLLHAEVTGDAAVIRFTARRLDDGNAEPIGRQLYSLVNHLGRPRLRLDLDAVEQLTSEALGKLIGLNRKVRAAGGELCLYNVRPAVYAIFEVTQLTRVLDVRPKDSVQTRAASA